ncbi:MAG: AMP-binding protein [Proteobacteria bacterium]|nr:AMP-binding protein [Pseudomonadota bacterium]
MLISPQSTASAADYLADSLAALTVHSRVMAVLAGPGPAFAALLEVARHRQFVLAPLDPRLPPRELLERLRRLHVGLLLYEPVASKLVEKLAGELSRGDRGRPEDLAGSGLLGLVFNPVLNPPSKVGEGRPLDEGLARGGGTLLFTSGTAGQARAVFHGWRAHETAAACSRANLGTRERDLWLANLPVHHVSGLSIFVRASIDRVPVVAQPRFDREATLDAIENRGVTLASAVPTMLGRLLDLLDDRPLRGRLRALLLGGAPCPGSLLTRALRAGFPLLATWGMTETAAQAVTARPGEKTPPQSCGRPLPGVSVAVRAPGSPEARGSGHGELLVKTPGLMAGYLNDQGKAPIELNDHWFATGDLGRVDEQGFVYCEGRRDDLIISGGENVNPSRVEGVLREHEDVLDAAVFGLRHTEWGRQVTARVVLKPGASLSKVALTEWARERLAPFELPRTIEFSDDIPRGPSGKLLRLSLPRSTDSPL